MVSALTVSNAVQCARSEIQSGQEVDQRAVCWLALEAPCKTTNEEVQEDTRWVSFEVGVEQSKLYFEDRLDDQAHWWLEMGGRSFTVSLHEKRGQVVEKRTTRRPSTRCALEAGGKWSEGGKWEKSEETNCEERTQAKKSLDSYKIRKREITRKKKKCIAFLKSGRDACEQQRRLYASRHRKRNCA